MSTFVCFLLGFLWLAWVANERRHVRRQVEALAELAARLEEGSWLPPQGWWSGLGGAHAEGSLEGRRVRVVYSSERVGERTLPMLSAEAEVLHPVRPHFEIRPSGVFSSLGKRLGLVSRVSTGDARLDHKYVLDGCPSALGELLRDPQAEQALDRLLARGAEALELRDSQLRIRCESKGESAGALRSLLVDLSTLARLCERAPLKLELFGERPLFGWAPGQGHVHCPYCRDALDPEQDALAACERCATVHHRECLAEAQGCVVFGCEGGRDPS